MELFLKTYNVYVTFKELEMINFDKENEAELTSD